MLGSSVEPFARDQLYAQNVNMIMRCVINGSLTPAHAWDTPLGDTGLPSHFVLSLGEASARAGPGGCDSEFSFDPSVNIYFCVQPAT